MSTQTRKRRGRHSERLAAAAYRDGWPYAEAVGAGSPGRDITGTPGICNEVKARAALDLGAWLRQCEANAEPGEVPLVICRLPRQGPTTVDSWGAVTRWSVLRRLATLADLDAGDLALQVASRRGLSLYPWLTAAADIPETEPLPVLAVRGNGAGPVIGDDWPTVTTFGRMRTLLRHAGYGNPLPARQPTAPPPLDADDRAAFDAFLPTSAGHEWLGCTSCANAIDTSTDPRDIPPDAHDERCPHSICDKQAAA